MPPADETAVVVDTDVFSFILGSKPEAADFIPHIEGRLACISFQTVAELHKGAEIARWGESRRAALEDEIRKYVVIEFSMEMARIWARIMAERRSQGLAEKAEDGWIAATAIYAGCPVVTNNLRDFTGISGLDVLPGD